MACEVLQIRVADDNHVVVSVKTSGTGYRKKPCKNCPWRKDAVGVFPTEAFRLSAVTARDMSRHLFGCHASGTRKPKTCAGFLLKGAEHNLDVRLGRMKGEYSDVRDGGISLHEGYREMAIANGVDENDHAISMCR